MRPFGRVVPQPVSRVLARGGEGRATDDQRAFVLQCSNSRQRGQGLRPAVEIVHVVVAEETTLSVALFSDHAQSFVGQSVTEDRRFVSRRFERFVQRTVEIPRIDMGPIPRLKFVRVEIGRFTERRE